MDIDAAAQPKSNSPQGSTSSPMASLVSIVLAVVAGIGFWLLMQAYCPDPLSIIPEDLRNLSTYASAESNAALQQALDGAKQRITIVVLAGMGALLGIASGLAGGFRQRSLSRAVVAATVTAFTGALGGALGGFLSDMTYMSIEPVGESLSLMGASLVQIIALGLLGAGIGIGMGAALGSQQPGVQTAMFGLFTGAMAGLLFPITTAVALPTALADETVPLDATAQLVWVMLTALLLGLVLPMAGSKREKRKIVRTDAEESPANSA